MANILIPLPRKNYDPSEVAIPWKILTQNGHNVFFATPTGEIAEADHLMLTGRGLDFWGFIPGFNKLKLVGLILRANKDARIAHAEMQKSNNYQTPLKWAELNSKSFDGIVLPGGHCADGMREYLESLTLQNLIVEFFQANKIVAAICHGVLLAARSIDHATNMSVLYHRKTTSLTWDLEKKAWKVARISRFWDGNYYRTYVENKNESEGYWSVQSEVTRYLENSNQFLTVSQEDIDYKFKTNGRNRDSLDNSRAAFVVQDKNYISARWPGDVFTFSKLICEVLKLV